MTDEKKPADTKTVAAGIGTSVPKITRRRFTKAGAVAPVIMTLASRPVWGETCSFSGQLSGNDYATAAPPGGGLTPQGWLSADESLWPTPKECEGDGEATDAGTTADSTTNDQSGKKKPAGTSQPSETGNDKNPILKHPVLCYAGPEFASVFGEKDSFKDVLSKEEIDPLKAHIAAAILNILSPSPQIVYGYKMDGLIGFLDSAAEHPHEALAVLQCLNGRSVG